MSLFGDFGSLMVAPAAAGGGYSGNYLYRPAGGTTDSGSDVRSANQLAVVSFTTPAGAASRARRVYFANSAANNGLRVRAVITDASGNVVGYSGNVTLGTSRLVELVLTTTVDLVANTEYRVGINFESSTTIRTSGTGTSYRVTMTFGSAVPGSVSYTAVGSGIHCWVPLEQEGAVAGTGYIAESADNFEATASTMVVPMPTDYAIGDVVFLHVAFWGSNSGTAAFATPDQWTLIDSQNMGVVQYRAAIYARVIDGTESPVMFVSQSGASAGSIMCKTSIWRGVNTTGAFYEQQGTNVGNNASPTGSSVTTTGTNRLIASFYAQAFDRTFTKNASWTLAYDEIDTTRDIGVSATTLSAPTATTYAAEAATYSNTTRWRSFTLALLMN